jgi:hypothetical protein
MPARNAAVDGALGQIVALVQARRFPEVAAGAFMDVRALAVLQSKVQGNVLGIGGRGVDCSCRVKGLHRKAP